MKKVCGLILAVLCSAILASCASTSTQVSTTPSLLMISLERTPCFGRCPVYKVSVYGDGTVRYDGKEYVKVKGSQTRVISPQQVQRLLAELQQASYFSFKDDYDTITFTDAPLAITAVTVDGRSKRVRHYLGDATAPKELTILEERIDEVSGSQEWVGTVWKSSDTGRQTPDRGMADKLWAEGKDLYAQKLYAPALEKFKESLTYGSTSERTDYVRQLEASIAQNRARAKALRDEAYAAQGQGNTKLALAKYRESLQYWPDRQLEEYLAQLERRNDLSRPDRETPRDDRFCGPVDENATVPADFAITYSSGPTHAEWGSRRVNTMFANGNVVTEEIAPPRGGRPPAPQEQKPPVMKRVPQDAVKRVYARVIACEFFDLKQNYWNQNVRDGGVSNLTVTANAKTHRVTVYYYDVPRYESILSSMREEMNKSR
ncbi:MAG: hypothetical protein H6Q55_692 [Deltaproteobacteria bacterium]|nr:hypothetical protein [Deltaproteobacteria bacterium]